MIKIITGAAKGKKLETLPGEATRPTSQRIKEAIFSSIQFDIEGRRVLDLFAGTGQLGLEALSRGAASATFIDSSRDADKVIKANAKSVGYFDKCRYLVSDWRNYVRKASGKDVYDLVFIDPPYALHCAGDAVLRLKDAALLSVGALIVIECGDEPTDFSGNDFSDFEVLKHTSYGKMTTLTVLLYRGKRGA